MPPEPGRAFDVRTFQRWMFTLVTHPDGVEGGEEAARAVDDVGITDVVLGSKLRSPAERIAVYADMYFNRLIEILSDDFESVAYALGDHAFYHLAHDYLVMHPSRSQRLVALGQHLPAFIREHASGLEPNERAFLAELAELEMALELVFHAKRSPKLDPEALRAIPPEQWAAARLVPVTALDLLATDYPVNPYYQDVREGREPALPDPERSWVAMWRKDFVLWRSPLTEEQFTILLALRAGETLGDALMRCIELRGFEPERLMSSVGGWFEDWTADGLFAAVILPD